MEKKYLFPEKFWWGASTSATQTEGSEPDDGKEENIWDYSSKKFNNRFYGGITSQRTSTFYKNYKTQN